MSWCSSQTCQLHEAIFMQRFLFDQGLNQTIHHRSARGEKSDSLIKRLLGQGTDAFVNRLARAFGVPRPLIKPIPAQEDLGPRTFQGHWTKT